MDPLLGLLIHHRPREDRVVRGMRECLLHRLGIVTEVLANCGDDLLLAHLFQIRGRGHPGDGVDAVL